MKPAVLLTFDVEEFDIPEEYGHTVPFEDKIRVSEKGFEQVLALLDKHQVKATIFCTAVYASERPAQIRNVAATHEIASHGFYHSAFQTEDLKNSREALELITGQQVYGYRMARLAPVDEKEIEKAGYLYNSSMNPTWIPGRYNHLSKPRKPYFSGNILNIPTSVSPNFRIPLFWLSFKNFPEWYLRLLLIQTIRYDKLLSLYFHPWEFTDISAYPLPGYIKKISGAGMLGRLERSIIMLKAMGAEFITMKELYDRTKRS